MKQGMNLMFTGGDGKTYSAATSYEEEGAAIIICRDETGYTVVWEGTPEEVGSAIDFIVGMESSVE